MTELNPNHPVTSAMHEQWHKIVALLMMKFKKKHIEISEREIECLASGAASAVTIRQKDDRIILDLVSWEEAERLAKKEGGGCSGALGA